MPVRYIKRPRYEYKKTAQRRKTPFRLSSVLFAAGLAAIILSAGVIFMKELSTKIALSDAADAVTVSVSKTVAELMSREERSPDYFVTILRDSAGLVSAVNCNMTHINLLSSEILDSIVGATESRSMTVSIPAGNLTGLELLTGAGPMIPVKIVMLTSSRVEFENSMVAAGINQTKHQINLKVIVDIDVFVPWSTDSTTVITNVLISDTVIVGQVPEAYMSLGA